MLPRYRRRSSSFDTATDPFVEELNRIKKSILFKGNKNMNRFTIAPHTDEQLKTVATMLPDEVLCHTSNYKSRNFEAAVFFADISGFTDLSDKYQSLENGASKLSTVINFYLGSMVQEILSHDGDIIKYAGDAFLAIFRADKEGSLQTAIHKALDTALIIQKNCSNYLTEIGITLNGELLVKLYFTQFQMSFMLLVKIAISGGEVLFSLIGDENSSHYVVVGDPIWHVKSLQETIKATEILVSSKAWFYVQESHYLYYHNKDLRHYKIEGFRDILKVAQRQQESALNFHEMRKTTLMLDNDISVMSLTMLDSSINHREMSEMAMAMDPNEAYSRKLRNFSTFILMLTIISITVRPSINLLTNKKSKRFLHRFIIKPVLNIIDLNESIDFLTEMRQIVVVFVNFVVAKSDSSGLVQIVNEIYNSLCG